MLSMITELDVVQARENQEIHIVAYLVESGCSKGWFLRYPLQLEPGLRLRLLPHPNES